VTSSSTPRALEATVRAARTVRRILHRVVEQIGEHLFDAIGIGRDQTGRPDNLEQQVPAAHDLLLVATDHLTQQIGQIKGLHTQRQ